MKDLLELAKILPNYIILFCPGYLTIYMYYFFLWEENEGYTMDISESNLFKLCIFKYRVR